MRVADLNNDRWDDYVGTIAGGLRDTIATDGAGAVLPAVDAFTRWVAFNDAAMLTATANDLAYDQVFSLPLQRLGRPGDLVIAISSSGNSPNIVRALETARQLDLGAVTVSGMRPDNRSRTLGQINLHVPLPRDGWVESAHQIVLHYWLDQYLTRHGKGAI
jgi:D-sedoheptulose 7-phosphate isomerase